MVHTQFPWAARSCYGLSRSRYGNWHPSFPPQRHTHCGRRSPSQRSSQAAKRHLLATSDYVLPLDNQQPACINCPTDFYFLALNTMPDIGTGVQLTQEFLEGPTPNSNSWLSKPEESNFFNLLNEKRNSPFNWYSQLLARIFQEI